MKRQREDQFDGPALKKQRIDSPQSQKLDTAGWGISDDDDSEEEDDLHAKKEKINAHNNGYNDQNTNNGNNGNASNSLYSNVAQRLMSKMGYVQGTSLGKTKGGITEPIAAYERIASRGGLGFDAKLSLKPEKHEYEAEEIQIEIKPVWYQRNEGETGEMISYSELESFLQFKPRCDRVGIEWNETFCSIETQKEVFAKKSEFDEIGQTKQFMEARNKANPFEGIKREIFQNRAALKICEIDRNLNYAITAPANCITFDEAQKKRKTFVLNGWKQGNHDEIFLHRRDLWTRELIYFADLCSGPGGFSEYFLHINKWQCRGWGFTLRGNEDFKLNKFNSNAPWDNFTPEYGSKNNGDITDNDNLCEFRNKVVSVSMSGCHIVMADGGFDCFPDYNSQELLSRQLILCQFLCAMSILRKDGVFVCKIFDCFHPFTASILYIASMCFEEIALMKPNQSRPANSERYVICKGYKFGEYNVWKHDSHTVHSPHYVIKHLLDVNCIINKQKKDKAYIADLKSKLEFAQNEEAEQKTNSTQTQEIEREIAEKEALLKEVCPLIPADKTNASFILWLKEFNEINGKRQVRNLLRIKKYLEDKTLRVDDQITIRKQSLKHWFNTPEGRKFIVLDPQFGCRYVTKYEDYTHNQYCERPLNTLIINKELLRRIEFEFKNTTTYIYQNEFGSGHGNNSEFKRYNIRGDWFSIAFDFKEEKDKHPPKWVTLICTGNRNIYECKRQSMELLCVAKTNELMRLPADTVIDCIKTHSHSNQEIYHIFDCWVIGSKSLYKRNFIQRQEFCRVLYQGYGSKYIKFAGAIPALQSIQRECIVKNYTSIYLWFIRTKKSTENDQKRNPKTAQESQYWRPCSVKKWNGASDKLLRFDMLLQNLKYLNNQQMQNKQKQQRHCIFTK